MIHESVLLKEAIDGLDLQPGDVYLDATLGSGFHAEEAWKRLRKQGTVAGIDADQMSLDIARANLALSGVEAKTTVLNFRHLEQVQEILGIERPNKILFDLGWNSPQFAEGGRGFSFQKDEPLLMTFSQEVKESDVTAYDVVNDWSEESLADIIYGYGEEKYARRIAKAIVQKRNERPINSSLELAQVVKSAVPIFYRFGRIHPATRTFQAIRIAVNDELGALEEGLTKSFEIIPDQGRIAVISFHSLEDRIVKNFFKSKKVSGEGELLTKKPILPTEAEIKRNPRSRSAKLRIIKKKKNNNQ
jgi:16S rRNA (cytosine1402-N4)-methyltransferase